MRWLLLLCPLSLTGQITVAPGSITLQAATLTCTVLESSAACTCIRADRVQFQCVTWAPTLNNGADESFSYTHNGNVVSISLSMWSNAVHWYAWVRPAGGVSSSRGWELFPPPAPAGPAFIGARQPDGSCSPRLPVFAPSFTTPIAPGDKGADWVQSAWTPCTLP